MKLTAKTGTADQHQTECIVVGVFENKRLGASAKVIDQASKKAISALIKNGDITGKAGQTATLYHVDGIKAQRVLVIGCGSEKAINEKKYSEAIKCATQALLQLNVKEATFTLPEIELKNRDIDWKARKLSETIMDVMYQYSETRKKSRDKPHTLKSACVLTRNRSETTKAGKGLKQGEAIAAGVALCKELGNLPANICTPGYLASQARQLGKKFKKLKVSVLEEKDMKRLKMGSFLSVARGSHEPAKLIVLEYKGAAASKKPVALVGKGVTFDSGGISLKPGAGMDEMKYDMCGAASVLGTVRACAEMGLPINIVGIIPATENLPGGSATKPGDIVTSMSGQTIEILNTDAEGRLILCDALTYAKKYKPEVVIDIATLTGAVIIALGRQPSGLLTNHQPLGDALLAAGEDCGDRAWQLPLWDEYQDLLKSNFADIANIGGREAGTVTAACFLSRFTEDYHWAHLDIAGTAWNTGGNKGATGRPVPLLTQYLLNHAGHR